MKANLNERKHRRRSGPWQPFYLCLVWLVMAVAWTGCRPEPKVASNSNPAGTYALVSVDGNQVPCTVQHEGHALPVKSGAFVILPDGTCSSKIFFTGRESPMEVKATYTQQGSKLVMKWEGAGMTTGTVEGGTFTMDNEGMRFSYRK